MIPGVPAGAAGGTPGGAAQAGRESAWVPTEAPKGGTRPQGSAADGPRSVGLGMIGVGRFGQFCLSQYTRLPDVAAIAVTDVDPARAEQAAQEFGTLACRDAAELIARPDIDLVYIGTPPATHADLALSALGAGKHVLCEKPLATQLAPARDVVELARSTGRIAAVNLMMRYNPLCLAVANILDRKLLGEPLHAFFENYADDQVLPPPHWFWDRTLSGGIFIEHGVHFFDLFQMWFGPGQVEAAQEFQRPGSSGTVEQVACSARYGQVQAHFYHGFHQPTRMDRQELRVVCERGSIRLFEWIPTSIEVDCLADDSGLNALVGEIPNAVVTVVDRYQGAQRSVTSRHKDYEVSGRFMVHGTAGRAKMDLYADLLRQLMADQVAAIRDPAHPRRVTEQNGLESLAMAVRADELARQ